jgi:hypothetical protein
VSRTGNERSDLPSKKLAAGSATAALALAAVLVAAGCGGSRHAAPPTTAATTTSAPRACPLSAAQRRDVAKAKREIVLMHRLEQPLKTVHETGPPPLENAVNRFLLDVGPLPSDIKGRLMDKGKAASALCKDCFDAIEAVEPTVQTRLGRPPCASR